MRRIRRSRSLSSDTSIFREPNFWIISLLVLLVILNVLHVLQGPPATPRPSTPVVTQTTTKPPVESKPVTPVTTTPSEPKTQTSTVASPLVQQTATARPPSPAEIRIQILNGSGVRGLADRVRTILKDRGYMVKSYGNAERQDYRQSQVVVRIAGSFGEQAGILVAQSLGISSQQTTTAQDPILKDIDVTVIVGRDYRQLNLALE
ncbi:MAG: LytR C-terminal domain-containing protein [bacterium]|nr:LytR C-terminal domain-containing protein [bacterium]